MVVEAPRCQPYGVVLGSSKNKSALQICFCHPMSHLFIGRVSRALPRLAHRRVVRIFSSVSHLLHMTFVLGLCGSLCHPCFVNPAMESPPRLLSQRAILPAGR